MVYEVILDPLASDEWIAILSRYNAIREGLGTEAYDEVKVYLFALAEDAFLYP